MQKYAIWVCSALVATLVYAGTQALEVPSLLGLLITFFGAIAGAYISVLITLRLQASRADGPPGPGNGRTAK
jgi:hypothetical protein